MAAVIDDFIQQLHDDVSGALSSDPGFTYVPVYQSRTPLELDNGGNPIMGQSQQIEEMIKSALAGMEKFIARTPGQTEDEWKIACATSGKAGLACVVMLPDVKGESVNSAAPAMQLIIKVRLIENRLTNEGVGGTGITASKLALHVVQVLNRRAFRGGNALYCDLKAMVQEVPLPDDEKAHECVFIQNITPDALPKVATPTISAAGTLITLACTTAGSAIYYTLDGGYPGSGNAAVLTYTEPFTLAAGDHRLRTAAEHEGMQASNDLSAEITID
jgi:hypothetical protein